MSGSGSGEGDPAGFSGNEALVAAESADAAAEVAVRDVEDLLAESATARGRQANLTFFAFTATPKHKTLALFGEAIVDSAGAERYEPFHLYSMRQAIEGGVHPRRARELHDLRPVSYTHLTLPTILRV